MAWIESHQEVAHHPKTRKLARRLEISIPTAVGHLHCLWHWALSFAEDGNLSKHDAEDVAIGAMWEGDGDKLLEALKAAGYVDATSEGLLLHDWWQYAGKLIDKRRRDAERKKQSRGQSPQGDEHPEDVPPPSDGQSVDGAGNQPTVPTEPTHQPHQPADEGVELRQHFEAKGRDPADIDAALERFFLRQRFGEQIKDPVAWLSKLLDSFAQARTVKAKGPKRIEVSAGEWLELRDGQWVELEGAT